MNKLNYFFERSLSRSAFPDFRTDLLGREEHNDKSEKTDVLDDEEQGLGQC